MNAKRKELILKRIAAAKELSKKIASISYFSPDQFIADAERYIKAVKEGRMICAISSVSRSGMSRNMSFSSMEKHDPPYHNERRYSLRNYFCLFMALGYTRVGDDFRIGGCGMDMVFHTNYTMIHHFKRLGFITDAECRVLAQRTPPVL